jgi:hypothetical protein
MKVPRWLDPRTNPAGWSAALGLAYATWQGITAAQAQGPLTWRLVGHVAAGVLWAAVSAYVRSHVTPVLDPRDGNGDSLIKISSAIAGSRAWKMPGEITPADVDKLKAAIQAANTPTPPPPEGKP